MISLIHNLKLEFEKTKRRGMWLLLLALWLFQHAYLSYGNARNTDILSQGWLLLLYNMPVLNAIILPIFYAVLSSRLIDCEHKENTWKLIETLQSKTSIFLSKALTGLCYIVLFSGMQLVSMFVIGTHYDFGGRPDPLAYALYTVQTILISFILYLIQLILSFTFSNQAVSLCVGLAGGMAGLFIMFLPRSILYEIIPWGLFGANMFVAMDWDPVTRDMDFYYGAPLDGAFFWVFLWIICLLIIGWFLFQKRPVEGFSFYVKTAKRNTSKQICKLHVPMEYIKLKGSPIWIAFILLPLISAFIGSLNYLGNIAILDDLWYSLWSQHTIFLCYFFMPALLGVYCSYLWRLEHTDTNWNQLLVHISPWKLVRNKLLCAAFMLGLSLLWITVLFLLSGKIAGVTSAVPSEMPEWIVCGFLGGLCICCVQLFFSLVIRSFAIPIAMALMGSIASLALTTKGLWYILPYSIFSVGMRANNPFFELDYGLFGIACICICGIFYVLSVLYLKYTDVRTQE